MDLGDLIHELIHLRDGLDPDTPVIYVGKDSPVRGVEVWYDKEGQAYITLTN